MYSPQVLRYDKRTKVEEFKPMNFGESKGLTFDRVLIFPHGLAKRWLSSGNIDHVKDSLAKMYVGVSRARYSVALVFDGATMLTGAQRFTPLGNNASKAAGAGA
jgi:DNA helicase-2/ATP-dependent DNA helicase PcrA